MQLAFNFVAYGLALVGLISIIVMVANRFDVKFTEMDPDDIAILEQARALYADPDLYVSRNGIMGGTYRIIGEATLRNELPIYEATPVVVFQREDSRIFVMPADQFKAAGWEKLEKDQAA